MKIGLDFDNTIVSYEEVFHSVARELGHIPEQVPVSKIAVRDYLRAENKEDIWTELQGYVYGTRMEEAYAFPGALEVLRHFRNTGHELFIVSHKTKMPYSGPAYDLQQAARNWIHHKLKDADGDFIASSNIFFCEKKNQKISKIGELGCEIYIDDLQEILNSEIFPKHTIPILFDPQKHFLGCSEFQHVNSWDEFKKILTKLEADPDSVFLKNG